MALRKKTDQETYHAFLKERLLISPQFKTEKLGLLKGELNLVMLMPDTPYALWRGAGIHIIGNEVATRADYRVDFANLPFPNVIEDAEQNGLKTLYSNAPIAEADILGVSFANPALIYNFFKTLELGRIPLRREERDEKNPLIVAGHLGVANPAPLEPFVDAFVIGDGDDAMVEIAEEYKKGKDNLLERIAKIEGVYVPEFAERSYVNQRLMSIDYSPGRVKQRRLQDLTKYRRADLFSKKGEEAFLFIDYGCRYKCGFCQMANLRGKYQANAKEKVKEYLKEFDDLGVRKVILAGASSTNYPSEELREILLWTKENLKITKPIIRSVRIDDVEEISEFLSQEYLHIAPETGSDSLRNKILLKSIKNEDIRRNIREMINKKGVNDVRMYCIVGIPSEIETDRQEYVELIHFTAGEIQQAQGRGVIRIDMYPLMPQPGTPFEEFGMIGTRRFSDIKKDFDRKVQEGLPKGIEFRLNGIDPLSHALEGILNTGDVSAGEQVLKAYQKGGSYEVLLNLCKENGVDLEDYIEKGNWEVKPWSMIQFVDSQMLEKRKTALLKNLAKRSSF